MISTDGNTGSAGANAGGQVWGTEGAGMHGLANEELCLKSPRKSISSENTGLHSITI